MSKTELAEKIALVLINSDRRASGLPEKDSRENIPDSNGYVRSALDLIDAFPALRRPPTDAVQGDVVACDHNFEDVGSPGAPLYECTLCGIDAYHAYDPPSPQPAVEQDVEREICEVIAERDVAESVIAGMYEAVTGKQVEWTSAFAWGDALAEVKEEMATLSQPAKPDADARALLEALQSRPVRTHILNVDTREEGEKDITMPIELRDRLIAHLSRAQSGDTTQEGWRDDPDSAPIGEPIEVYARCEDWEDEEDPARHVYTVLRSKAQPDLFWLADHSLREVREVSHWRMPTPPTNTDGSTEADDGEGSRDDR